ncbi:MAG: response regulator transcription factor [Steroidobacteraceae bacterium]
MRILIVDDDPHAREHLTHGLSAAGHSVVEAVDAQSGLTQLASSSFDVMVLDRLLPDASGLELLEILRSKGNPTPVLMLTAVGDLDSRVEGIEAGADDYLVKPFALVELLARLQALHRRAGTAGAIANTLRAADLELDLVARTAVRAGARISLQPREFSLLEYLLRHQDQLVTRAMLLQDVWKYDFDPQTSIVETHMSRLRAKVDRGFVTGELIQTVRGEGYMLQSKPRIGST